MSKIIYTNSDGGVSVVHPTGEVLISELPAKLGLTDYEIVNDDVIPTDRTFVTLGPSAPLLPKTCLSPKKSHMSVVVPLVQKSSSPTMK